MKWLRRERWRRESGTDTCEDDLDLVLSDDLSVEHEAADEDIQ